MSKIVSFIIPSYNAQKFLDKCILSFVNEEVFEKMDIIIVNDGSTDNTSEIAEKYCRWYSNSVRLINQENRGHGGALNTGCAAAVGKYLKVIDADDWVETRNLTEYVRMLEACESDVVLTHHYTRNISSHEVKKWKSYPPEFGRAYTFEEIMADWKSFERSMTFHGITYRTEFYHQYGIQLSENVFYEDHEFATIPCCYAKSVMPLDLFIYNYRIGDIAQSVSDENQLKRVSHTETVLKRLCLEYKKLRLAECDAGKNYYCRKTQGLLMSYLTTVMLVEKNKKKGRKHGNKMMLQFSKNMPKVFEMTEKRYKAYKIMNICHVSKNTLEKILNSRIYRKICNKHDFN